MVLYAVQNLSKKMGIKTLRSCFSRILIVRPNFLGQNIVTFASVFFNFNLEQNFYKNFSRSYHEEFHPPRVPGKDDITGSFYNLGLSFETENTSQPFPSFPLYIYLILEVSFGIVSIY